MVGSLRYRTRLQQLLRWQYQILQPTRILELMALGVKLCGADVTVALVWGEALDG